MDVLKNSVQIGTEFQHYDNNSVLAKATFIFGLSLFFFYSKSAHSCSPRTTFPAKENLPNITYIFDIKKPSKITTDKSSKRWTLPLRNPLKVLDTLIKGHIRSSENIKHSSNQTIILSFLSFFREFILAHTCIEHVHQSRPAGYSESNTTAFKSKSVFRSDTISTTAESVDSFQRSDSWWIWL